MKKLIFTIACLTLSTISPGKTIAKNINPFAEPSTLPLQAPDFDKIKDADYLPAFDEGMRQQLAEVKIIAENKAEPTFDNTIIALEKSGRMLERVSLTFFAVVQANSDKQLEKIQTNVSPKLAMHQDAIFLNPALYARVKALYDNRDKLALDAESMHLLTLYYHKFEHAGAKLNEADKTKLRALNKKLASLETEFQQKLIAGANAGKLKINDKADLDGLSDIQLAELTEGTGNNKTYVIPLQNTTQQPLLSSLTKRETREKLFAQSWNRTEREDANDTRSIITKLAALRAEKAKLLGYPNYAAYVLYDQMANNPENVSQFLGQLIPATSKKIATEGKAIQSLIDQNSHFDMKPWDWNFYAEKIRKAEYDLDENELKPYFELDNVLKNGVFYAATQLYGITFKERHDIPVYHPDVRVFDVYEKDGSQLGLLYIDYFKRDSKAGGAWMSNFVQQSRLLGTKPVVYNVTNFTKPAKGMPALLTYDDVRTMFHEFGHALHGLFSNVEYPMLSNDIARDFVEFPSQFNEHWALYPDVLKHYAVNYKTGEVIPQSLIDKIKKAATFNQGYALGELLAAAKLDMQWHELTTTAGKLDVDSFETEALKKTHTDFPNVPPRYRSSYFLHIWANGYPAGYYAYIWTEMLDDDAFDWFVKHNGMTRENGQRYRDLILSRGHSQDYNVMFRNFYGKDPEIGPMLENRGL